VSGDPSVAGATPDAAAQAYVEQLPEARGAVVARLRALCLAHLDGFTEGIRYGMPGYWRDPSLDGDPEICVAGQKQYASFYVLRTDVLDEHRDRLAGLDVGKGCVRYRRPEQLDEDVVVAILRRTASTSGPVC